MKLNRHLAFPFRIGADGRTTQVLSLEEHVRDEIIQLLLTNPGERLFKPEFGGGVRLYVFSNMDDPSIDTAQSKLTHSISTWLGERITLEGLKINVENEKLEVRVSYKVIGSDETRTEVFRRRED